MTPALQNALRTAATLLVFTALGTGLLAYTFYITKDDIASSEAAAKRALIAQTLPKEAYDNDLLADTLSLPPAPELGTRQTTTAYRARLDGKPSAVVLEVIAPNGYSGKIHLLVAILANGEVAGVRVTAHQETPGLGDYIDAAKSDWIKQFDGMTLGTNPSLWRVKKDGGRFDYMTGATISPRAVIKAVHGALRYYEEHGNTLFAVKDHP